jgi:hypothetical protein
MKKPESLSAIPRNGRERHSRIMQRIDDFPQSSDSIGCEMSSSGAGSQAIW